MKEVTKKIKDYLLSVGYLDKEKIYYFEVWLWLWLWREKKIPIECLKGWTEPYKWFFNIIDLVKLTSRF